MAKTLMIQGTSSNVGKSLLTAALCHIYHRRGVSVVPFKSQNMALNSFVTPEGHEIGRAQVVQAIAAGLEPHVDMNPILLKPEADSHSQIVLMGKPWKSLPAGEYYKQRKVLWSIVCESLERLKRKHDLIIIEGAGSPAEINLNKYEIVNMRVARHLQAPVLLTGDIDRGGIFASLYGTLALLDDEERSLVKAFVVNKFRGDIKLLEPGIDMLTDLTGGIPTLGIIPYIRDIVLAQEDSVFLDEQILAPEGLTMIPDPGVVDIAVIRMPHISNYDDFDPLQNEDGVGVRFVDSIKALGYPDAVILPGTKTTISDLSWFKESGLADAVRGLSKAGIPVCGICGGFQMLGERVADPDGIEGDTGSFEALGLLSLETVFEPTKTTTAGTGRICSKSGFLSELEKPEVTGYEIHMGRTKLKPGTKAFLKNTAGENDGGISRDGKIWGSYFHGIFDNDDFRRTWLRSLGWKSTGSEASFSKKREDELERLADQFEESLDMNLLDGIIGL